MFNCNRRPSTLPLFPLSRRRHEAHTQDLPVQPSAAGLHPDEGTGKGHEGRRGGAAVARRGFGSRLGYAAENPSGYEAYEPREEELE